ncbi:hypothetical protein DCAR_0727717 [Daucus carota subsp. sativus]|uniref:DUF4371 domain-containing protein n=1 Tax=Daucus carota subsp. sativus TaxID=79200 RepID=A0AAF0XJT0_DAUCS|nr:hypothetical protein DCAR_0727717 [Daucus carota subsp. sativus]
MNQERHIEVAFETHSTQARKEYRMRLTATIDCIRFLLHQGLAFRRNDESSDSVNQGNFLQLLKFLSEHNETINKVVLKNAPGNSKLIAPQIQHDIVHVASGETTKAIINDLNDEFLSILIYESRDIAVKEQMAILLRYVNLKECVIERFLSIVHVSDTTSLSLKLAMEGLFSKYGLSISSLRGQGYDGESNMRGEFNGFKALILKENPSAYYVHCFAHQLQLALVAVEKNHSRVALLFNVVSNLSNIVGASCKRRDLLRETQYNKVIEAIQNGDIQSGTGLHQESSLQRSGDTRWSSHYVSLVSLITMLSSVIDVLDVIVEDGTNSEQKGQACALLALIQSFEFVFDLHLMKRLLALTNDLSQALQRKDQDIINAIGLVKISKQGLQEMRDSGWESLLIEVSSFCVKNDINVLKMDDKFVDKGRSRKNSQNVTNLHHYQVESFFTIVDMQLQELNNRFTETNSELLFCIACLNPKDSFAAFDKKKLIQLAQFYPYEFSKVQISILEDQLETYIFDMRSDNRFSKVQGIGDLSKTLVETRKNVLYPLVFLLVKLALILPVATASTRLRNRLRDTFLNDCLVTYIEREIFDSIDNEKIIQGYQNMKSRREQL